MPKYVYRAKRTPDEIIEGTLMADNRTAAIQKLSNDGYFVISVDEYIHSVEAQKKSRKFMRNKVNLKDITNFTRQLADLLGSGLTIVRALEVIQEQTSNKRLKDVISDVKDSCVDGNPLSTALTRHKDIFSNLFISMVKSGEASGTLDGVLVRFAAFNDKQLEVQTKIRSAMAYPILMAVVGLGTITLLFAFVIPKIVGVFADINQRLPLPTRILLSIHEALTRYWSFLIIGVLILWFSFMNMLNGESGRRRFETFLIGTPLFGAFIKKSEIARFSRVLATLLQSGIPLLEALHVVGETMENVVVRDEIRKVSDMIREGSNLSKGFKGSKIVPLFALNMIAVGEESGHIEESLFKVAETYERETDTQIKTMLSLLEPVMVLIMGVIVGFIVISMLLPIFEINFMVGQ